NKSDVGHRLYLAACNIAYHGNNVSSGPVYDSMKIEGNKIRLKFSSCGSGLESKDNKLLKGFAIAGSDQKFYWGSAFIEGNEVVVSSLKVKLPVAVRYGWANNPDCNLNNREGLPAPPFRTDTWKLNNL
ncbi:MAG: sialate O-acetylesterase, partial [Bacteroidota bacterium]|nr:sialate O-acetylesterase [Bacteroidota bacterium]